MPPLGEDQILEAIASGDQSAADIARRAGMSILELAAHVCTPRNIEALGRVAQLHALQREMLLGKLKRDALMRLAELTDEVPAGSADEVRAAEVMRKACVDLLRYGGLNTEKHHSEPGESGGPGGGGSRSRGYQPESITPASEAEVLEALERLGQEDEEKEEEVYPQIEDSPRRIAQMGCRGRKSGNESENRNGSEPLGPPSCPPWRGRASDSVELVPWSKAKPQAMSGGREGVREIERTHDVQVGMAFGKTSDHGTRPIRSMNSEPNSDGLDTHTGETPVPPLAEAASLGGHEQVPPAGDDRGVGSLSLSPHGQAPKTPHAHATHNPLHHPRPPPQPPPRASPPF